MQAGQIFFSYSRNDAKFALKLAEDLRKAGIDIWIDQIDIPPSEPWDAEIQKALDESNCLLLILSKTSVASENVLNELNYAMEMKKQVLPILIDSNINKPFTIRRLQHIDFTGSYENGLNRLLKSRKVQAYSQLEKPQTNLKPGRLVLVVTVAILAVVLVKVSFFSSGPAKRPGADNKEAARVNASAVKDLPRSINGKWSTSRLTNPYDTSDTYHLIFDLEQMSDKLIGTVEIVSTVKRYDQKKGLLDGRIKDSIISFYTIEQSLLGAETVSFKNIYYGVFSNGLIRFNLQSDRPWGFPGQKFVARPDSMMAGRH